MAKKQISAGAIRYNNILADPIVRAFDKMVVNIINISIPESWIVKGGGLVIKYSKEITEKIDEIKKSKADYIKDTYPEIKTDDK